MFCMNWDNPDALIRMNLYVYENVILNVPYKQSTFILLKNRSIFTVRKISMSWRILMFVDQQLLSNNSELFALMTVLNSLWIFQTIDVWLVVGMGVFGFNIGF